MTAVRTKATSEQPAVTLASADRWLRSPLRRDLLIGGLTALAALVLACLALKVWRGDLDVPFSYLNETQYYLMLAKTMEDHGGYAENPSLGAPFGLELYDYAVGTDRLNLDLLRLLLLFGGPAAAVNLFFLLTFAFAAAAAYLVFRLVGVSQAPAAICSLLFALAPYHFERAEGHLFLSAYWVVPLGAYLVLATLAGEPLFRRRGNGRAGLLAYASRTTLITIAFCVAVASTGVYYAAFSVLLLAGATLIALVARANRAAVAGGAISLALLLGVMLVHLSPSIVYRAQHGSNPAAERPPAESELLALKFSDLVFPVDLHRIAPLARFTAEYKGQTPIPSERGMALGPVAAAGFLALLAIGFVALVGRLGRTGPRLLRQASAATLLAFLIGTVGGISTVIAYLVTPQLRGWNRISIFIAFFAFLAVAVALGGLERRLGRRWTGRGAFAAILLALLGFGLYNQVTYSHVPQYELAASYRHDRDFIRGIERSLPRGAAVFQLPYVAFPETGQVVDLTENDLLRGYLHSEHLRWSFGAMKGRPEDWVDDLNRLPPQTIVDGAAAAGFSGILVDRFGYSDRAVALERLVTQLLGAPPRVSESHRHSFFDLRPRQLQLASSHSPTELTKFRRAVLEPLRLAGDGFAPLEYAGRLAFAWAEQPRAELVIVNPSDQPRASVLTAVLDRVGGGDVDVEVVFPGGTPTRVRTPTQLQRRLVLPPGKSIVRLSTSGAVAVPTLYKQPRPHYFRLANLTVTDSGFNGFLEAAPR